MRLICNQILHCILSTVDEHWMINMFTILILRLFFTTIWRKKNYSGCYEAVANFCCQKEKKTFANFIKIITDVTIVVDSLTSVRSFHELFKHWLDHLIFFKTVKLVFKVSFSSEHCSTNSALIFSCFFFHLECWERKGSMCI